MPARTIQIWLLLLEICGVVEHHATRLACMSDESGVSCNIRRASCVALKDVLRCPLAKIGDEVAQYNSCGAHCGASGVLHRRTRRTPICNLQHLGEGLWYLLARRPMSRRPGPQPEALCGMPLREDASGFYRMLDEVQVLRCAVLKAVRDNSVQNEN